MNYSYSSMRSLIDEIRMSPDRIGVRFDFGEPVKPLVLDWGDKLYVAKHFSSNAGDDELQEISIMPV
jgi:hypothetical protein